VDNFFIFVRIFFVLVFLWLN